MKHTRLYIVVFLLVTTLPVMVVAAANGYGFFALRQTPGSDILNDRLTKLEGLPEVELVFLGDSSLATAIDEKVITKETGLRTANLSLTGLWGYAGSLALLERLLLQQRPPIVVLFHTTDSFGRERADLAYLLAHHRPLDVYLGSAEVRGAVQSHLTSTKNFKKWHRAWQRGRSTHIDPTIDAVRQRHSMRDELFDAANYDEMLRERFEFQALNRDKAAYLARIADLCAQHRMPCLYAHGAIASPFVEDVRRFLADVDPIIEGLGLTLLPDTPILLDYDEVGDSEDHVAMDKKTEITRLFAQTLKPYLQATEDREEQDRLLLVQRQRRRIEQATGP